MASEQSNSITVNETNDEIYQVNNFSRESNFQTSVVDEQPKTRNPSPFRELGSGNALVEGF